jgi:hypothetical protein
MTEKLGFVPKMDVVFGTNAPSSSALLLPNYFCIRLIPAFFGVFHPTNGCMGSVISLALRRQVVHSNETIHCQGE